VPVLSTHSTPTLAASSDRDTPLMSECDKPL